MDLQSAQNLIEENIELIVEYILILIFGLSSLYFLIASRKFVMEARLWPSFLASLVIILLIMDVLKEPVVRRVNFIPNQIIEESEGLMTGDEVAAKVDKEDTDEGDSEPSQKTSGLFSKTTFTVITSILYIFLSYLVGMLWVTPLYVAGYLRWNNISWRKTLPLAVTGFLLAYMFMRIMFLPLDEGILFGGI